MAVVNTPHISTRECIRWIPGEAWEPTSTLVLTSSERRYIDVRIFRPAPGEPELPNEGGPMTRLEWAFAGTSSTTVVDQKSSLSASGTAPVLHSIWEHWIDSRTDRPAKDEGDMFPDPDGVHTMEYGQMINPATGFLTRYEERWADEEALVTGVEAEEGKQGDETGSSEGGKRWCVVLELRDEASGAKGMVIRLGQWCQGIVKVRGEVSVERWRWGIDDAGGSPKGAFQRVAKLGRLFLPCALAFEPERVIEGSTVDFGDYKWTVVEMFSW